MVRRALWIIIIVIITGFFVYNYFENKSQNELKNTETKKREEAIKIMVAELVKRTNAIDNWEEYLNKKYDLLLDSVLTIDLENLCIGYRPILFIGIINDIMTEDKDNYRIEIERSIFNGLETELILNLTCPKKIIDIFLKNNPDIFKGLRLNSDVAVIADIKKIEKKTIPDKENGEREVRIGKGNCIDILYIGTIRTD